MEPVAVHADGGAQSATPVTPDHGGAPVGHEEPGDAHEGHGGEAHVGGDHHLIPLDAVQQLAVEEAQHRRDRHRDDDGRGKTQGRADGLRGQEVEPRPARGQLRRKRQDPRIELDGERGPQKLGLSPAASAAGSSSGTADIKLVIYEDETSDLSISIKVSGLSPSIYCTEEHLGDEYDIKTEGDTCVIGVYGISIDDMSGGSLRIKHRGDAFTVNMSDFSSFDDYESTTLTIVFPGKVTDADSNAKVDGNTANWSDVVSLGSARAEGKDVQRPDSITVKLLADGQDTGKTLELNKDNNWSGLCRSEERV